MDQQLTKEQIAAALNGREYCGPTVPPMIAQQAKAAGLIIVHGESDDIIRFRGAFDEEEEAGEGTKILIDAEGIIVRPDHHDERDDDKLEHYLQRKRSAATIETLWAQRGTSWSYHTTLPHATFKIMEDEDVYCEGIVIAVADLPRATDWQEIAERMSQENQELKDAFNETCTWKQPEGTELDESDCYEAECDGSTVSTIQGLAEDNDMRFCYRCGRRLRIQEA